MINVLGSASFVLLNNIMPTARFREEHFTVHSLKLLGYSYCKSSDRIGLNDELSRLVTRSTDHGLVINRTKCVECQ